MSYILDALRKSDEARRRGTGPILDRVRAPHEAPRRRWPWMVAGAVLVAANLAVITWVLRPGLGLSLPGVLSRTAPGTPVADLGRSRDPSPPPPRPPAISAPAITAPPAATALAPATGPAATAPARTPPVPADPARTTVSTSPPVEPAPVLAKRGEAVKPVPLAPVAPRTEERRQPLPASPPPAPLSPAPASSVPATAAAPPTDVPLPAPLVRGPRATESAAAPKPSPEAAPAGDDILSKLKLTVHVYAENPPDRLVFINGTKYVQGDRIDGKALVEEITQDGAVVTFEGRRAVLRH